MFLSLPLKLGALHSKVCNGLVWVSLCGLREGVLKVTTGFILEVPYRRSGLGTDECSQYANNSSENGLERKQV